MDENMNNKDFENETEGAVFGSSEYYKKLYDDFPEDVAEMLIGTHPLMKKEVSDELTHSIKIKSAREKNLRAVTERMEEAAEDVAVQAEPGMVSASKDPVEDIPEDDIDDYVGDITSFTKGLVGSPKKQNKAEPEEESIPAEDKSEDDITAEQVAKLLGGVDVEPVSEDELENFEEDYEEETPRRKARREPKKEEKTERPKRKRRQIDEKDLELSNIEKQANLNELFREDDDYYEEKHSGNGVVRIAVIIAAIVVIAFFIYKVASLSGQVSKLNEQIETYKTMETEYEQLKLDNLSLTEQVESLQSQLGGGTGESGEGSQTPDNNTTTPSAPASTNSGSKTYTVQSGDTYWGIATKMYGNGSYYTRILDANGLTENDKIREGMTLTIPAA